MNKKIEATVRGQGVYPLHPMAQLRAKRLLDALEPYVPGVSDPALSATDRFRLLAERLLGREDTTAAVAYRTRTGRIRRHKLLAALEPYVPGVSDPALSATDRFRLAASAVFSAVAGQGNGNDARSENDGDTWDVLLDPDLDDDDDTNT